MTEQIKDKIEYTYKIIKGGDGNIYVSVQPLMQDIKLSLEQMHKIDISNLSDENSRIFDLKMLGLTTVYEFLGGFVTEQLLKDRAADINLKGKVDLNTSIGGDSAAGIFIHTGGNYVH